MLLPILTVVVAMGAAIAFIIFGITISRRGASDDLEERLERYGGRNWTPDSQGDGLNRRAPGRLAQAVEQAVSQKSFTGNVRTDLARADLRLTVGEWLIVRVGMTILGFGVGVLLGSATNGLGVLIGLIGAVVGFYAPVIYLKMRTRKRVKAFVNQLGDTISLMSNSLRAGYSLLQTMEMVSRESPRRSPMSSAAWSTRSGSGSTPRRRCPTSSGASPATILIS